MLYRFWLSLPIQAISLLAITCILACSSHASTDAPATTSLYDQPTDNTSFDPQTIKDRLLNDLPPAISDGLDINFWGWFAYLHDNQSEYSNFYDVELSLGKQQQLDRVEQVVAMLADEVQRCKTCIQQSLDLSDDPGPTLPARTEELHARIDRG
jgi:hypothetical protein